MNKESEKIYNKNNIINNFKFYVVENYNENDRKLILDKLKNDLNQLVIEYANQPKAVKAHTHKMIIPLISTYRALQAVEEKDKAYIILKQIFFIDVNKASIKFRKLNKCFNLYKKMPRIFYKAIIKQYGEKAGFKFHVINNGKNGIFHVDMLECPYNNIFKKHGCAELTKLCCESDDICYGNMHDNLIWGRTKTLGRGDECCDFKLKLKH